ncbi:YadA-like family protein [Gallibacterium genomosp. 1]|uniref:YadA-like family protein n=1 Tax=Gallibacterium genomosp. 1 TaxID=155515 RepID=UPI000580AD1F|nr:YadA-like family protein [Gallibacterium genomosp. 1]
MPSQSLAFQYVQTKDNNLFPDNSVKGCRPLGSVFLNPKLGAETVEGCDRISSQSVAIGFNAQNYNGFSGSGSAAPFQTNEFGQTAIGYAATTLAQQATAIGNNAGAKGQATAIGNDVFANGVSSIAIGSDDLTFGDKNKTYGDKLPAETINSVFADLKNARQYWVGKDKTFDPKYNSPETREWSPTYAAKLGAIAIGSRAVAGGEVSTSVGSLSFALADRSTAMGIRTFVAQNAVGGTAIGEQSRVFAPNSIAMGNYTESASQGSFSYGYNAKAIGQGALAFGYDSAAGAKINGEQYAKLLGFTRNLHTLELFKSDGSIDNEKVAQFYAGVNTLIKGGNVNGTQFGGVAEMFADETLFEKDTSKEYLNIGGKSIYKTATSTSTFNSSDAAENSFAMGRYAFALRSNAMAFGYSTIADAQSSLAIGSFAHTDYTADNSIAFGVNTYAAGKNNFVAGYSSRSYANDSMALGVGSYIGQRSANSTAIGKVARVNDGTSDGMAIGNYSSATIDNSVALGVNSKTDYKTADLNQPGWVAKGAIAIPTSAATGLISVGAINNERRITNVASGYADTDAANVAQLRTIDEKFDNRIDSLENGGGVQYQSIDKSNTAGEAAKLGRTLNEVKDYQQYITLEKQWIGFKAREILNGEQINEASLQAMKDKADKLNEGGRFDSLSSELKALEQSLLAEAKGIDKDKYDDYVSRLTTAFESDSTRLPNNLTAEQIANLKKGTNYDNDGAQGADSIAFGWKAKTNASGKNAIALGVEAGGENGVSGEDGIVIGTKSKVSGNASIAMGKDNNVSGNNSIAVGTALSISGNNAGAFGDPSTINYDNSYSVGNNNTIGTATTTETEKGSFVVGNNVEVSADNVFVLGSGKSSDNKLKASQVNSVYLGAQSNVVTTGSAGATDKYEEATIGGQKFGKFAGSKPVGVVTVGNDEQTRRVQGVAAGLIAENSTDAINGSQLFATNTYLTNLAEKIGLNGKPINGVDGASGTDGATVAGQDGTAGAEGAQGVPGADGTDGLQGPAGRDGLNDTTLVNKVQSLRDGVAGTVVYTDTNGKRVLAENGKYYSADIVSGKVKANNGLWYDASKVNSDGTLKDANDTSGKTLAELGTAIGSDKVMLSAVNPDGKTAIPVTLANIASVLNIPAATAVTSVEQAKKFIGTPAVDGKAASGLYDLREANLNRAVTVADLQALGLAGITFTANSGIAVNTAIGGTFKILGDGLGENGANKYIKTKTTTGGVNIQLVDALQTKLDNLPEDVNSSLAGKANVALDNITDAGRKVIADTIVVQEDASKESSALNVTSTSDSSGKKTVNIALDNDKIKEIAGTNQLEQNYAKADASNITSKNGNQQKWRNALGAMTFSGDAGEQQAKKLGEALKVYGGKTEASDLSSNNIGVTAGSEGLLVQLAKNLTGLTSAQFTDNGTTTTINGGGVTIQPSTSGSTVRLTQNGLDNGGQRIQNVADATENGDAVNKGQMESMVSTATTIITKDLTDKGFKVAGNQGTEQTIKLGSTLNVKGAESGKRITTTAGTDGLSIDLSQDVKDKLDKIPDEGLVSANQSLKLTAKDNTATDPQSFNQQGGLNFTVSGDGSIDTVASGSTVTVKVAEKGIATTHLADKAVTTAKLADNAVTTAQILNGTILEEDLAEALKQKIKAGGDLSDNTIKLTANNNSTTATQALSNAEIAFGINGDGIDIKTDASDNTVNISLNKANSVTNDTTEGKKVVSSSAVYDAVKGAKTKVAIAGDSSKLLSVNKTENDDLSANSYILSLNKEGVANSLKDDFAKVDASNLDTSNVTAWKKKLGIDNLASSVSGITFKGAASGSNDAVVGLNKTLDVSGTDIEAKTAAASDGTNAKLELSLSQAVKEKLNQIDTTKGVATANQTIELTADNSTKTGIQRLDKDGGISFAIGGEGAIETNASNGKVTIKVKNSGITETMLADNAVTTGKIKDASVTGAKIAEGTIAKSKLDQAVSKEINDATALLDNTITLNGNNSSTTAQRLDSPNIAFNIKGADGGDITTTASNSNVTLTLNKATSITNTGDDANRVVTSSAVYSALAAAKPAVVKGEVAQGDTNLLDIVGTKSDGINGDTFKLSLSKKNLVTALQDDFVSAVNGAGIAVFDGQTTPSKKAVNLGEGIQLLGDGYVNATFETKDYTYAEGGKQHKAPILKFGVSDQVKTAIEKLNNGTALSGVTFNYKANGNGSAGKVGSVNGETGFDFRGDGSLTATNKNILISVEPTKQEKAGVIDFSLAEDLRDVKSIGSGSKDATGTAARLSFNSKNGDTAANITASNVKLTGLADGDISKTSSDAITGKQIFNIIGANNSEHGTITDRLNDLESGLRGTVVYTDKDGNKLVKVTNATGASEFYKATDVAGKHYYNGQWYETTAWNDAEGKPTAEGTGTATVATVNTDNILLSLVSAKDGATTTPITLANLASALDLPTSNSATAVTADIAKTKVTDLLTKSGAGLGRAATVADLQAIAQAGISFLGNEADTNAIHKTLGSVMKIEGKSGATYGSGDSVATNYSADNLITYKDGDVLRIAMKTKPTFQGVSLQNGTDPEINLTPGKTDNNSPTLTVSSGTDSNSKDVVLNGIAAGTEPNSAVNKAQLDVVANAVGLNGENGINGVDGANGPSGQDGLNGQSLANKVQALRDGLAGTVVYTDAKGVRVMSEDGKYYYPETLTKNMKKANDGLWYVASNVNADGTVKEEGKNTGKKLEALDGAGDKKLDANEVILSAVNATGNTTTPISVSNLASVLGAIPTTVTTIDAKFNDAKAKVGALLAGINPTDKDKEPEQQTKVDLDRAATAADLQVLAQAGLAFQGNDEAVVNRALSQTLSIKGEGITKQNYSAFQSASGNIVVGKDASEGTLVVKLAKDLNNIHSIGAGALGNGNSARITFTDKSGTMTAPEISVNNAKLKQVENGEISASSQDAINGRQLNTSISSFATVLGEDFSNKNGSISYTGEKGIGGTGKNTVAEAISALNTSVTSTGITFKAEGPSNAQTITKTLGQTLEFVTENDATDTSFKGENIVTAIKDGKVNIALKQASAQDVKDGKGGLVTSDVLKKYVTDQVGTGQLAYKANGENPTKHVALNTGLTFAASATNGSGTTNLTASTADSGVVNYKLNDVLTGITSISGEGGNDLAAKLSFIKGVAQSGDTPAQAPQISVNNAKITNVANGVEDSDAVNMGQLSAVKKSITDLQTASNSASIAYKVTDSKGVTSDGGKTPLTTGFNFTSLSDNIEISKGADNGGQIKFNLKDQLTGISSIQGPKTSSTPLLITLGEGILTLSGSGTKNGAQIKGVLKGVDDTDAVNMAQLKTMATTVGAKVGPDGEITAPTFDTAVKGSGTNNTAPEKPESLKGAVDDLITANNKGLTFSDGKNTTTKYFGDTLVAKSADLSDTAYKGKNLKTEVQDGNLLLAMKDKPEFAALALKAGDNAPIINLTPNTDANKPAISLSSGTDGNSKDVVLNGIAAGTADNSAVNLAQLNNLRNFIGVGKDGSNGVNGVDGVDGKNGTPAIGQQGVPGKEGQNGQRLVGAAGQDGLNGTTVINKVQALRDGVAGTMVYTDTAGNRLIAENGTFYKTDLVNNYAKANDGLWYAKDKVNADGSVATDVAGQGKSLKELAKLAGNEDLIAKSDKVILSAVNADGQTTQPITIANLKDNLVVAEVTSAEQANAENLAKAANGGKDLTDEQKAAVAKALKEQKVNATVASLLANTNTNTNELSRAVTLRDLQTVAQAGLSFAGNDSNNPIHQALGTTLLIQGKSGATYSEAVYSADNLITRNDKGTLRIEMKKTPTFDGIILDGKGQDGKDGKDGYIGVDAEGNVVVKNGVDGLAGKDGKDGVDGASKVLTEGSVNASAQLTYKAEGQGYTDKDGQKVDKPTVSLADGLNFKGDSNIKTAVNANGEVDITLNKDLTVDSIGGGKDKGSLSFGSTTDTNDKGEETIVKTINVNNSRIIGIADGKNRGDAVNKGQMDDAIGAVNTNINNIKNEVVNKGMNFATSNDGGKTKNSQTAKLGDTVVVKAGSNVSISEVKKDDDKGTFSYTISVKGIPMTYVDADGKPLVQVGDDFYHLQENGAVNFASTATPAGVKVVKDTTKLNDKAVVNDQLSTVDVAKGEIKNGSQQAVTGGQVADLLGVTVDKDGKVKDSKSGENGIGGTGKNTMSEAISETVKIAKSSNTEVKAGKNVIVTKGTGTNGTTAYTVSMDTRNLEVEKLILGKGDNKTTISVVNQSQYQGSEKAIDVGGTRITNVKDGIDPTDAVNIRQMNKLANATSKAINNVNRRVDHLTQESRAGIAGAMATAGLQQATERGRTTVSVGSAVFKGESAVALGISKLSDSGKVGIRISGMTTSNGDTGGSVSVGYTW